MPRYLNFLSFSSLRHSFSRRGLLIFAGGVVCVYALAVLFYIQSVPDLGLKSVFSTEIKSAPNVFRPDESGLTPQAGDTVEQVGDEPIRSWPDLLNAPFRLREKLAQNPSAGFPWLKREHVEDEERAWVRVQFSRAGEPFTAEVVLGTLPLEELIPSILWFFVKMMLFMVGALVLWKRPADAAAAQFFLLCIVTLGAYMGGYHWNHIAVQPVLILGFMLCAVMLPVVSLHFYQIFPRRKPWLERWPRLGFFGMYGVPLAFLIVLVTLYFRLRGLVQGRASPALIAEALDLVRTAAYSYLVVASVWYLFCVVS